jgi:hypothetical protein
MIKIIDNLIPKSYLKDLQSHFLDNKCEWYFNNNLTDDESHNSLGSIGFGMRLHWNGYFLSNFVGTVTRGLVFSAQESVEEFIEQPQQIVRVRADMTMYNPTNHRHELHTDFSEEHMTAIFYMNTSDGNTLLFDRDGKELIHEVEPIENRLVIFDGLMQHTGHSPSKHKSRVLINMNFMTPELVNQLNAQHGYHG